MKQLHTRVIATALSLFLSSGTIAFVSSAHAAQLSDARQMKVSYADLDLSTPRGLAKFTTRVSMAATEVCDDSSRTINSKTAYCRSAAIARAFADAGVSPKVTPELSRHG